MRNRKNILAAMICAGAILSFTACAGITTQVTETQAGVLLQISEHKTGYSIAGDPLPEQNQSKEFTLAKDSKIYEGLSAKADEYSRCILTITDISADAVTVMLLENGQEVSKVINYNTEYTYTAFINPDEYAYEYTITFVK